MNSPWDRLQKSKPSAAEVSDLKSRMNLSTTVQDLKDRMGEVEQASTDVVEHLGYGGDGMVPVDDLAPPAAPANVTVTPVPWRELDVSWDAPPDSDQVVSSVMEVTPRGGSASTVTGRSLFAYASNLAGGIPHTIRVKLVDRWGHESDWSGPVQSIPMLTAAEQIKLDELAMLGRLQGLLPNANLATIQDATKLGSGVVLAQAMAVQDAAALNLWVQNAAIQSAKIASIVADKITTGILSAATITLAATGRILAGGTTLGSSGITLAATAHLADVPAADYTVSNSGGAFGSLHFFDEVPVSGTRGAVLRADGDGTSRGHVAVHGLRYPNGNPYDGQQSAGLDVKGRQVNFGAEDPSVAVWPLLSVYKMNSTFANSGSIYAEGTINANGDLNVGGNGEFAGGVLFNYDSGWMTVGANGGWVGFNHNWGLATYVVALQNDQGSGGYKVLPGNSNLFVKNSATTVRIYNNESTAWQVRIFAWRGGG